MSIPIPIRDGDGPTISLLIRNRKRWIPDMLTFYALGIQAHDIKRVSDTLFARIPAGDKIISIGSITSCPSGITCSTPPTDNEKKIMLLYKIYLDREPDQGGFTYYLNSLNNNTKTLPQIKNVIVSSSEFIEKSLENADAQTQQIMDLIKEDTQKNRELSDQQNDVNTILDTEQENIDKKQQLYEKNSITQQRETILQQNSTDRMKEYNTIMYIIIASVSGLIGLSLIDKHIPIFPEWIFTILRILISGIGLIWCYIIFARIQKRDPLNFQKIQLDAPHADTPEVIAKKIKVAEDAGNLLSTVSSMICSGDNCCGANTKWDDEKMLCVPDEPFSNIKPNEPNDNYSSF
jgi:hypothetical protein